MVAQHVGLIDFAVGEGMVGEVAADPNVGILGDQRLTNIGAVAELAWDASEMLVEARTITLEALRMLFDSRTDLLALHSGDERSRALIMGGTPS